MWWLFSVVSSVLKGSVMCLQLHVTIEKNPELGFSISGGVGGRGNPFRPDDYVCTSSFLFQTHDFIFFYLRNCVCVTALREVTKKVILIIEVRSKKSSLSNFHHVMHDSKWGLIASFTINMMLNDPLLQERKCITWHNLTWTALFFRRVYLWREFSQMDPLQSSFNLEIKSFR